MIIFFIRHGEPNYETDSLTELGKKQALALSNRLREEKIDKIYSSVLGRAKETAMPYAAAVYKEIITLSFMKEVSCVNDQFASSKKAISKGISRDSKEYKYYISDSISYNCYKNVSHAFDNWLKGFGIVRYGNRYINKNMPKIDQNIALFSHSGVSSMVLSHILDIPLMTICGRMKHQSFTAVSAVDFTPDENGIIIPSLIYFNDFRHIKNL